MADGIQLNVGGDATASQEDVRVLEQGLGAPDTPAKDDKTPKGGEAEGGEHVDNGEDGGEHVDGAEDGGEDERSGRVDNELADASNEQEREAIRARRRQERADKKTRARDRVQTLERQVQQSQRQLADMTQQMQLLTQQSAGFQMARLESAITEVNDAVTYFEGQIADGTTKGDGEGVAKATSNLMAARERAKELGTYKEAMAKSGGQRQPQTLDPKVVDHAKKFMAKHPWYGGPRSGDMDSQIMSQIDNQVAKEGFDPTGPEYWQELETRASRYLGHRFQRSNTVDPDDDASDAGGSADGKGGYNGRANNGGDRRTPRSPVAGNSGDARGAKGGGEGFLLSSERVRAIKDAGKWDDPKERQRMISAYKQYDREHKSN